MKTISISQVILFFIICFLLFGDLQNLKKKVVNLLKQFKQFFNSKV